MPQELLKRIIEQASDSLAGSVYLRMLMDRRAVRGQLHLRGTVPTWEDIVARAVDEATLTRKEATRLLAELRDGRFAGVTFRRARSSGRGGGEADARSDRWQREERLAGTPWKGKHRPTVRVSCSRVFPQEDGTLLDIVSVSGGIWPESGRRIAWRLRHGI